MASAYMLVMDTLSLCRFAEIVQGRIYKEALANQTFSSVTIDSRRVFKDSVFFPLQGTRADGHQFVSEALDHGAIAAVVAQSWLSRLNAPDHDRFIVVKDPLEALQRLAAWWREQLRGKVIGIT